LREQKRLKSTVDEFQKQARALEDAQVLAELADEATDDASAREAETHGRAVEAALDEMEWHRMMSGESDALGAIVTVNSGAGGIDAADWAQMLLRMLMRYSERHGWKTEILDEQPAEEAGIKSATLVVDGEYAYGLLKAEMGVHRLVRISPFDQNARRQTSFAAVSVSPDVEDNIDVEVRDEDLRVDVFRSGGAGGQHVNKTESAVRLTHLPTGIVVVCQSERSQHMNKNKAMRVLKSRIYERKLEEQEAARAAVEATKTDNSWGNQIRSYVFQPYTMVTDHRTELKVGDVQRVMNGDLDEFIEAYLKEFGARVA